MPNIEGAAGLGVPSTPAGAAPNPAPKPRGAAGVASAAPNAEGKAALGAPNAPVGAAPNAADALDVSGATPNAEGAGPGPDAPNMPGAPEAAPNGAGAGDGMSNKALAPKLPGPAFIPGASPSDSRTAGAPKAVSALRRKDVSAPAAMPMGLKGLKGLTAPPCGAGAPAKGIGLKGSAAPPCGGGGGGVEALPSVVQPRTPAKPSASRSSSAEHVAKHGAATMDA